MIGRDTPQLRELQSSGSDLTTMRTRRKQHPARKGRTPNVRRWVLMGVGLVLVASVAYAAFLSRPKSNAPSVAGKILPAKSPSTLTELLALKNQELEGTDIAVMNLLCAEDLPGAEHLSVADSLAVLDQWTQHAKREIERNRHRFRADPGRRQIRPERRGLRRL